MLYLKWLTTTEACDSILRNAIFSNSLVNLHSELDIWYKVDLDIELYNLSLKELLSGLLSSQAESSQAKPSLIKPSQAKLIQATKQAKPAWISSE